MTRYADTIGPKPQRDPIRGADAFLSKYSDDEARDEKGQWTAAGSWTKMTRPEREAHLVKEHGMMVQQVRATPSRNHTGALPRQLTSWHLHDHGKTDSHREGAAPRGGRAPYRGHIHP